MAEVSDLDLSPEQCARLAEIWERLFQLYLAQANAGAAQQGALQREIDDLVAQRNAIRDWGWSTGRDAGKDWKKRK